MRVLFVSPAFFPAASWGGPIFSAYGLCNALGQVPHTEIRVATTNSAGRGRGQNLGVSNETVRYEAGYDVYFFHRMFGVSVSGAMIGGLFQLVRWADVVHLNGVYSFPTFPTFLFCRLLGKPLVWSARGAFQRWSGSRRTVAKKIWELGCRALMRADASLVHATSLEEGRDCKLRMPGVRVCVIRNGVNVAQAKRWRRREGALDLKLLYLGRLDPIKGVENLLRAVALVKEFDVSLVICGAGSHDYREKLNRLAADTGAGTRIRFAGHVEGEEKEAVFDSADVCVVPSFSENFGMVVAEALGHGVPVIAGRGTPWEELDVRKCGMWVANDPASLASAIETIARRDLAVMGEAGRLWMQEEFSWDRVAGDMHLVYGDLVRGIQGKHGSE